MRRILASALLLGLFSVSIIGCADTAETKTTTETKTPTGSVKETDTKKVEATGDAKPADAPK